MSKFLESLCYYAGAVSAEMYPSIPLQLSVPRTPLIPVQWHTEQRILLAFDSLSELCHELPYGKRNSDIGETLGLFSYSVKHPEA